MSARETRTAGVLGELQNLAMAMEANKDQLPDLEALRLKFAGIVTQSLDIRQQQVAFQASKQESSKQLQKLLTQGKSMADVLRTAVKNHFGSREEKIVEFGLQPFRGRKVKAAAPTPTTPTTPTTSPASTTPPAHTTPTASTTPPVPAGPETPAK
jgi:hypothetical protein